MKSISTTKVLNTMISLTVDLPAEISEAEVRLLLALKLYEEHRLSLGKAAELAGYSKAGFMEVAGKHGVAVFDYAAADLETEMKL